MAAGYADIQKYMAPLFAESKTGYLRQEKQAESAAAGRAAAQAEQARQQKLADLEAQGYGKPQRRTNEVGGYTFYDKKGNPISASEFSSLTENTLDKVLEGSLDPNDNKFIKEYVPTREYMKDPALIQEDLKFAQDSLNKGFAKEGTNIIQFDPNNNNPDDPYSRLYWENKKSELEQMQNKTPLEIIHGLTEKYGSIFGGFAQAAY